jgi:hypothetical protein
VIDEINIYYEIAAAKPLFRRGRSRPTRSCAEKALDDAGLQYTPSPDRGPQRASCASA